MIFTHTPPSPFILPTLVIRLEALRSDSTVRGTTVEMFHSLAKVFPVSMTVNAPFDVTKQHGVITDFLAVFSSLGSFRQAGSGTESFSATQQMAMADFLQSKGIRPAPVSQH